MADEIEGSRASPVKFIDQTDGTVAERVSMAEAGAAGNTPPCARHEREGDHRLAAQAG